MIKLGKNISSFSTYSCQPKTKKELRQIIKGRISIEGPNCDLNDIDTSLMTDMSFLFYKSSFDGNISNWNVSNVKEMTAMFRNADFNGDISNWDVSNVDSMEAMFAFSKFDGDISGWDVGKVTNMYWTFAGSEFNKDISDWNIRKDCVVVNMFLSCQIKEEYKPKSLQK